MVTTGGEGVGNVGAGDERGREVSKIMVGALLGLPLPLPGPTPEVGKGKNVRRLAEMDEINDEA